MHWLRMSHAKGQKTKEKEKAMRVPGHTKTGPHSSSNLRRPKKDMVRGRGVQRDGDGLRSNAACVVACWAISTALCCLGQGLASRGGEGAKYHLKKGRSVTVIGEDHLLGMRHCYQTPLLMHLLIHYLTEYTCRTLTSLVLRDLHSRRSTSLRSWGPPEIAPNVWYLFGAALSCTYMPLHRGSSSKQRRTRLACHQHSK